MGAVWAWFLTSVIYPLGKLIFTDIVNYFTALFKEKEKVNAQNEAADQAAQNYQKVEDNPQATKQEKIDAETNLLGGG